MIIEGVLAMTLYVGGYTDKDHLNGLSELRLDAKSGAMEIVKTYGIDNALYLVADREQKFLYMNEKDGLGSFAIGDKGELKRVDFIPLGGRAMCHLAVTADGKRVTWAAYSNALAGSIAVKDGAFGRGETHTFVGKGPNAGRQEAAHFHCAVPTPDGKGYAVCDLGTDRIFTYTFDGTRKEFVTTPAGAGPRHVIFHPNGRLAFVVFELRNLIASYEWSAETGFGKLLDQQETLPKWPTGRPENGDLAAAIRFSPDMKRVIVSNRGEQSLVAYDYDETTGKLALKARTILPGSWPRDFIFVGDELAVVTMERSGEVHSLKYDTVTGEFKVLATVGGLFRPVAAVKLSE